MIRSMEGFTFASALDLNMGYYHITLDADFWCSKAMFHCKIQLFLSYPVFNQQVSFHVYTDAYDNQFGAVIMQDKKQYSYSIFIR
jgi:hypothetical protein